MSPFGVVWKNITLSKKGYNDTVDGRNLAPVHMVNVHYLKGFMHARWCRISSSVAMNQINTFYLA